MKSEGIAQWTHREVETILHSVVRYTRFVRSTKVILGLLALFLVGLVLFYPLFKADDAGIRIAFTSIEKGASTPTKMINAQFHGLDKDRQPYNVGARTATQKDENIIDLDKVTGDITLKNGVWLSVSADAGVFFVKEHLLDLKGAIDMFNDEGYEFRAETMHVDIGRKTALTHDHVEGQGMLGKLKAHGAFIDGNKKTIDFEGPVFVTVFPPQGKDQQEGKQ